MLCLHAEWIKDKSLSWFIEDLTDLSNLIGVNSSIPSSTDFSKAILNLLFLIKGTSKNKKINLIVGPEGDFSDNEKKIINEKNFIKVNLGRTILRTETAIVSLISIINELLINND